MEERSGLKNLYEKSKSIGNPSFVGMTLENFLFQLNSFFNVENISTPLDVTFRLIL